MGAGGRKMAPGGATRKSVTMYRANVAKITLKIVNYALVRQTCEKTRFKSKTAKPGFGHFWKNTILPFLC